MKCLVTGGAGFIGSHLAERLASEGHEVFVVDDLSKGRAENLPKSIPLHRASIGDAAFWNSAPPCDVLLHLAAQSSVSVSSKNPDSDFAKNIFPIPFIFDYVTRVRPRALIFASSGGTVYGDCKTLPTPESSALQPISTYGATKAFFEGYLSAWAHNEAGKNLISQNPKDKSYFTWASLRLGNVYGARQAINGESGVIPIFFSRLKSGKAPTIFGNGQKTRDYVSVDDVTEAFVKTIQCSQEKLLNENFNIGRGIETSDLEVFQRIRDYLHKKVESRSDLKSSLKIHEALFESARAADVTRSFLDVRKAKSLLGWEAKTSLDEALPKTLDHYIDSKLF